MSAANQIYLSMLGLLVVLIPIVYLLNEYSKLEYEYLIMLKLKLDNPKNDSDYLKNVSKLLNSPSYKQMKEELEQFKNKGERNGYENWYKFD